MRLGIILVAGLLLAALLAASAEPAAAARPEARWVGVSVATLWVKPALARSVDEPSTANPADPRSWVRAMTLTQKRWLVGRLETQALYGSKVYVLGTSGAWSKVAVLGQPTPRNHWGYPGWMPTRQLTDQAPDAGKGTVVIRRRVVWVYRDEALTERVLELSYGTRLPVSSWTAESVAVSLADGGSAYLRRSAVALRLAGAAWPVPSGAELVAEAKRFLGLQYLWAGTSGFGFDCSGFTHLVYRTLGVTIPRDAGPQAEAGRRVATRKALRPGDLVFFRSASGAVHHVGLFVGSGRMIHAPATGKPVAMVSLSVEPYRSEFAGGRRYVP